MDHDRNAGMAAAVKLTREGRLKEVVTVLQRTLRRNGMRPRPATIAGDDGAAGRIEREPLQLGAGARGDERGGLRISGGDPR